VDQNESGQCYVIPRHTVAPSPLTGWRHHHLFLSTHDDFRRKFSCSILQNELATPLIRAFTTRRATRDTSKPLKSRQCRLLCRMQLENCRYGNSKCPPAPKQVRSLSFPLGLCCKLTGHKFSECNEDTTPLGVLTLKRAHSLQQQPGNHHLHYLPAQLRQTSPQVRPPLPTCLLVVWLH